MNKHCWHKREGWNYRFCHDFGERVKWELGLYPDDGKVFCCCYCGTVRAEVWVKGDEITAHGSFGPLSCKRAIRWFTHEKRNFEGLPKKLYSAEPPCRADYHDEIWEQNAGKSEYSKDYIKDDYKQEECAE